VSRRDAERLADILAAIDAIEAHLTRGGLADGLVFDAVRLRLIDRRSSSSDMPGR
jgi:hypothetical protein